MTDQPPAARLPLPTQLVDGLPVAAVLVERGTIVAFNRAAEVLYQRLRRDALGAGFVELLFDPDDQAGIGAELADVDAGSRSGTWRVRRGDGVLLVSSFRLERLDAEAVCWIATDTMDQGLAEQERAVLLSAEHAARADAEAARFRLNVLSSASSAMTSTLELETLLPRVSASLVPAVADLCVVELIDDDGELTHLHVGHLDEVVAKDLAVAIARQPIDRHGENPIATVLRTGEAQRYDGRGQTAAAVQAMARDDEQSEAYAALGLRSTIVAPIRSAGSTRGVLAVSAVERPLHPDDLAMVTEVAHRLSLAVGNAEAYDLERHRAETLQLALLPTIPHVDGLDVAVRYLAATEGSEVGGDWYDVVPLDDGCADVVIGDVVGHDERAAVEMGQIRNALRAYACVEGTTPATTLGQLDRMVAQLHLELATAVVAHVDVGAGVLTWSNAGHPPPLLVVDGTVTVLGDYHGAMLGLASTRPRLQGTVAFPVGASLVLYTDGAVEDRNVDLDVGIARVVAAVEGAASRGTEAICDAVVDSTRQAGPERRDDIAILVVEHRPR